MTGLHVYTSNRLEQLCAELAAVLASPPDDVLEPEVIVVQSRGMERWLCKELARRLGCCANCTFPFPNALLDRLFGLYLPELAEAVPLTRGTLHWTLMQILPQLRAEAGFEKIRAYLSDDASALKRFQLCQKLSDTFDQYLIFRPDMLAAWEAGKPLPAGDSGWQARLWREVVLRRGSVHRARLQRRLIERIGETPPAPQLPPRICLFGISYLPPYHLEVLRALAGHAAVHFFLLNPCREFWADIVDAPARRAIRRLYDDHVMSHELHLEEGNRLLASMGKLGRDFLDLVTELEADFKEVFVPPEPGSLLGCVQKDVFRLQNGGCRDLQSNLAAPIDNSLQIHVCHSQLRELEVLYDQLLRLFESVPELAPADVVVMAPQIDPYAPLIEAVFNAPRRPRERIPFSIADRSPQQASRVIDAFMRLLELRGSRLTAAQVVGLLEVEPVRSRFGLDEAELDIVRDWLHSTRVAWGADGAHRSQWGLPPLPDNTWKAGVERLLLGYAMAGEGDRLFQGILPHEDVEGERGLLLGRFLRFLEVLFRWRVRLEGDMAVNRWSALLGQILDEMFLLDEDGQWEAQLLRRVFDEMRHDCESAGFDERVAFEGIHDYIKQRLTREFSSAGFIAGGVTFCSMLPMRSIPFEVVCLIGMNDNAFPREERAPGFDLTHRHPRKGDRSRRQDDKYLFLEALISARRRFYISYIGRGLQDNAPMPPSVLVSELLDYVNEYYGVTPEKLCRQHPLQAFSKKYYDGDDERFFSYSTDNLVASAAIGAGRTPTAFCAAPLTPPDDEWRQLDTADLGAFFVNPARFLLRRRLGLFLDMQEDALHETEAFVLDPLDAYLTGRDILSTRENHADADSIFALQRAKGRLPHGAVGRWAFDEIQSQVDGFRRRVAAATGEAAPRQRAVELELQGFRLYGRLDRLFSQGRIDAEYAKARPKYLVQSWIHHLVACAMGAQPPAGLGIFIARDGSYTFDFVPDAPARLQELLDYYWEGLRMPLPFFPESSFAYARERLYRGRSRAQALAQARRKWGDDYAYGYVERADPYLQRCFAAGDPLDERFERIAVAVFQPFWEHARPADY